ncbi:unnamed protein product [Prorocentrum cordatum]|uniref:Uncharacterized protein n=1 Tax=Prorocentrum cordatum TaxID=2364126 RepID=A0ABN9WNF1_9DINO|nr:unnamed protein product [Polarella glacialis]
MAASGAGGAITEVRLSPEKGRCLFVAEAVAAGSVCLAERPLVASSPAAAGQLWDHLCSGGSRLGTLACDPQWCLAALTAGGGRGRGSAPGQLWRTSSSPRGGASQRAQERRSSATPSACWRAASPRARRSCAGTSGALRYDD